jgi:enterobacterial common antigen flippase
MPSSNSNSQLVDPPPQPMTEIVPAEKAEKSTYGQILKSTALVGGSSALNIVIGMVRAKSMAMLLGPAGFGLFGLYSSIANLTQSVAGMGINSSGVRQIAAAVGSGDTERIARTTTVLRRISVLLGALGAILLALFSRQVSTLTFGTDKQMSGVYLLSIAVFFSLVSAGQGALIQGMRRISDLAKMSVLGALFGTLITIPAVYFFRERGVVPSLVGVAGMSLVTSWWYSRKVRIKTSSLAASQVGQDAGALLKLGFAFMTSSLMAMGSAYVVRITVLHKLGFEATGLYQAAWTLGVLYVGFILQAMGADFYPRLTASAHDNSKCNRLVNEQARVSLLLAGPGVIATLTFAPVVIGLFYSARFGGAVGLLRWICLGATLQVISWPMGFILVAKNDRFLFVVSDLLWAAVHVGLAWTCVRYFGLNGAGIAFFGSYIFHVFFTYGIVRHRSAFRWSIENKKMGLGFLSLIMAVFCAFYLLPFAWAVSLGTAAVALSGAYSIRVLATLVPLDQVPRPIRPLLAWLCPGAEIRQGVTT